MTKPSWFVLHVDGGNDRLLRCTSEAFDAVNLHIDLSEKAPLDDVQSSSISSDHGRYTPEGAQRHADGNVPRATQAVNDLQSEHGDTERYLRKLGRAVQDVIGESQAPLYLAMGESRATIFEMVGGVEVAAVMKPHPRAADLWRESRALRPR